MSKKSSNIRKSKSKNSYKKPPRFIQAIIEPSNIKKEVNWFSRLLGYMLSPAGVISIVAILLSFFFGRDVIHKLVTSTHDLFIEDHFVKGLLISDKAISTGFIDVGVGGTIYFSYPLEFFKEGEKINASELINKSGERPISMDLIREDNRIFVNDTIRYILNDEIIGIINEDQIILVKDKMLDYYTDDSTLEVKDNQGNIALSLTLSRGYAVKLLGYFISNSHIFVCNNQGFSYWDKTRPGSRDSAIAIIKGIKATHDF